MLPTRSHAQVLFVPVCVVFVWLFVCVFCASVFVPHASAVVRVCVCDQPVPGVSGRSKIEHRQVWHIRNLVSTRVSRPQNNEYPSITNSETEREVWEREIESEKEGRGEKKRIFPFQRINDFPILTQFSFGIQTGMQQDINLGKSTEKLGHLWAIHFTPPKQISNLKERGREVKGKRIKRKLCKCRDIMEEGRRTEGKVGEECE